MKKPWLTLTGMCSVVLAIVVFCVIFGGYSSLLRSQNRIEAAKELMVEQCLHQIELMTQFSRQMTDLKSDSPEPLSACPHLSQFSFNAFAVHVDAHKTLVNQLLSIQGPVPGHLIHDFETSQIQLNQMSQALVTALDGCHTFDDAPSFLEKEKEYKTGVFITGKRYNKEAQYFNNRTQVFPGRIIARIFSLDEIRFPVIATRELMPEAHRGEGSDA